MGRDGPGYTDDRFRAIFEAALDGMLVTDDQRRYIDANPAACRLLGRRRDELLRLRIEDVSAPSGDLETAWTTFLRAGTMTGEYQLLRPGGSTIEVEFQATANVVPGRHLSVIRDVTSRKKLERELRELSDQLREAHDRERSIASTLQEALLPRTRAPEGTDVATRYLPASPGIGVCGDWYSVRQLAAAASASRSVTSWATACRPRG